MVLELISLGALTLQLSVIALEKRGGKMTLPKEVLSISTTDPKQLPAAGGDRVVPLPTDSEGRPVGVPSPATGGVEVVVPPSPGAGPNTSAPKSEEDFK
jgi:hypothetical protein